MPNLEPDKNAAFYVVLNAGSGHSETELRCSTIRDVLGEAGRTCHLEIVEDAADLADTARRMARQAKENNGVLVRVNNASGVLFDPSFLSYQVSELTRLRQLMSEVFISEGLDAALNIDRESFNYSHPHYQYLQKWVHFAVRQTTNKLKGLNKEVLDAKRARESFSRANRLDTLVGKVWEARKGADAEPPPTVRLAPRGQALLDDREGGVLVFDSGQLAAKAADRDVAVDASQVEALAKVLSAWGMLDDLSWDEQQSLLTDIAAVFGAC